MTKRLRTLLKGLINGFYIYIWLMEPWEEQWVSLIWILQLLWCNLREDTEVLDCFALNPNSVPCGVLLLTEKHSHFLDLSSYMGYSAIKRCQKIVCTIRWYLAIFSLAGNFGYDEMPNTFFQEKSNSAISPEFHPLILENNYSIHNSSFI